MKWATHEMSVKMNGELGPLTPLHPLTDMFMSGPMSKQDRLYALTQTLQDGTCHRAEDLARVLNVSVRTIYRDVEALQKAGVAVAGTRGQGYHLLPVTTLPPLALQDAEITAILLGLEIVAQAEDPELADAARRVSDRLDAAIPGSGVPLSEDWKHVFSPHADAARVLSHLPTLRRAIKARQKLEVVYQGGNGPTRHILHPYETISAGSLWTLRAHSETSDAILELRLDLIDTAHALPALFAMPEGL